MVPIVVRLAPGLAPRLAPSRRALTRPFVPRGTLVGLALSALALSGLALSLSACSLVVDGAIRDPMMMASACEGIDDGTACERPGITAPLICLRGVCTNSRCGDGVLDSRPKGDGSVEACDDGNGIDGDECESDCTQSVGCIDPFTDCFVAGGPCVVATCIEGECGVLDLDEGSPCDVGDGSTGACMSGLCVTAGCGDMVVDTVSGEQCDDGNFEYGDGCSPFCKPECSENTECSQDPCLGVQQCMTSSADNGGQLGVCVESSSPLDCGDGTCSYCDSTIGACLPSADADADGDGFATPACGGTDCDDTRFDINPDRVEECDPEGLDVNCNPSDEPTSTEWFADCDGDTYPAASAIALTSCDRPTAPPTGCASGSWTSRRPVTGTVDCVDSDADVSPGQRAYFRDGYGRDLSYDYDCDGRETARYGRALAPLTVPCGLTRCTDQPPVLNQTVACGELATLYYCSSACARYGASTRYYVECH